MPRTNRAGFTLIELLVSVAIMVLVLLGVLALFDLNNRITRVQTNVSDMQQSIRIAQYDLVRMVRMAGRGGLPRGLMPAGLALAVRNNVSPDDVDSTIAVDVPGSPDVLPGTDVLTVRGVINNTLYMVNPLAGLTFDLGAPPPGGTITVQDPNPVTGVPQDLQPLIDAITDNPSEALLIVSPLDEYAVVEIDAAGSNLTNPDQISIHFTIGGLPASSARANAYIALVDGPVAGAFSPTLTTVNFVGVLEEHRFYVREWHANPLDASSELVPRLTRARFYPGTEVAHPSNGSMIEDIADNILDLQVALGIDTDPCCTSETRDRQVLDDTGTEAAADEWLFNHADDDDPLDSPRWDGAALDRPVLHYVRLTTLARTDRRDPGYRAPTLGRLEDKDYRSTPYSLDPYPKVNDDTERMFRRRFLRSLVDFRNL